MIHRHWVLIHRWLGLSIAASVPIAGLTGSVIAFERELSSFIAPELHAIRLPYRDASLISPVVLRERILAEQPERSLDFIRLDQKAGEATILRLTGDLTIAVDPYTGEKLAIYDERNPFSHRAAIIPFLVRVHYSLGLGSFGITAFGVAAFLWTIDSFVALVVALPNLFRRKVGATHITSKRWWAPWTMRLPAHGFRLHFDLHRAGGLWLWPILLIFAWSSVGFNLPVVYSSTMNLLFPFQAKVQLSGDKRQSSPITWSDALNKGRSEMATQFATRGMYQRFENSLYSNEGAFLFEYAVNSSADRPDKSYGTTTVFLDAGNGRLVGFTSPADEKLGDTVSRWLVDLHVTAVWGRSLDITVSLIGLAAAGASITGVLIWWGKRSARRQANLRHRELKRLAVSSATEEAP